MNDFDHNDEPVPVGVLVGQVERIMLRRQANTETLRKLWTSGDLPRSELPCHSQCDGMIQIHRGGESLLGLCPMFEDPEVCPLPALHEQELLARMKHAGFDKRYWEVDPEKIRCREAVEKYLAELEQKVEAGAGLIFSGDVGVGKTMILAYMARRMLVENYGVWCVNMESLIAQLMNADHRKGVVERLISVQILMLDDFGAGEMMTWVLSILEGVIERRYAAMRPVLVSTNMPKDALIEKAEFRRMVDRWRQCNLLVKVGGTSQRHD